jgi:hypothetical protein
MKLKPWIHSALHIGCVALLLLQGHRIWQLRREVVEQCVREMSAKERLFDTRGTGKHAKTGDRGL